ncbi:MAG: MBL fold metallo-hydrolase [Opitutus sp.]|nr:MBL fold metallo-hydrolase [Opitutus sp.]
MKPIFLATVFALAALPLARGQDQKVTQLAPGVFFWQGDTVIRRPANCTWVIFKDYVLVIDANFPWGAREILPEIKRTTAKPIRFVFNTHYHADHAFGNGVFMEAGATIVSSRESAAESRSKGETDWKNQVLNRGQRPEASEYDKAVAEETRAKGYQLEHPTLLFDDRLVFDDGEHRVELIHVGPGHTIGDSVAYLPKERILVTGDLCVNWGSGNNTGDRDADPDHWVKVLDTLAQWDVKIVVPGHGRLGTTEALRGQREYLADIVAQVRAGLKAGKTADQLVQEIDLSRHQPWGASRGSNAVSIRAIYRRLSEQAH